jgi:tetratricopeptide (TPR) repeat protein/tRNA A-37 threonylcarbamoyl transferase component Bud32
MSTKCPNCQTDNTSDSRFCKSCAAPLLPSEEISASPTRTLETPVKELTRGTTFAGRYEFIEVLGRGGMGKVYKVFDKKINDEVAIKILKPEISDDEKIIERFSNELKLSRKIVHKNVGRMYDINDEDGTHFITMEYVPGEDLKSFIKRVGHLPTGKSISIAKQVCEGLIEAHRLGVVHRDLKPSNIMIDREGNARIMDFGIARSLKTKGLTSTGVMVGTPEYMSPEQVEGKEIDKRSDIYSLGVIIFEMLTGKAPFSGETPYSVAFKHKTEPPPDPKELNVQIPEKLSQVILKCMEKIKEERYQKAEELFSDLTQIEKAIPTTERVVPNKKPSTLKEKKAFIGSKKMLIPALGVVFLAILVAAVLWIFRGGEPEMMAEPISVMVVDFQNMTGDPVFDGTLEQALCAKLRDMPFILDAYSPPEVRQMASRIGALAEIKPDPKSIDFPEAKRDVEMARVELERAENEYNRMNELRKKNLVSKQKFNKAEYEFKKLQLRVKTAQERLDSIEEGQTKVDDRPEDTVRRSPFEGRINISKIREIGQNMGVEVMIYGVISRDDKGYSISVTASNVANSIQIANISETIKTKAKWEKSISRIASGLRSKFHEHLLTAASLEAMSAYARAEELVAAGKLQEAIKEYHYAIQKDPDLSIAYVSLSAAYRNLGDFEKSGEYLNMAYARRGQLPERDRDLISSLKQQAQQQQAGTSTPAIKPISILIGDFQNETGEPIFEGAVEQFLTVGLENSSFIDTFNRASARSTARRLSGKTEGSLGLEESRLVSLRAGINTIVSGSIKKSEEGYDIHGWLEDPVTEEKIVEDFLTIKAKKELPLAMNNLSSKLISSLGQVPTDSVRIETGKIFTTSSLEAMRAYARAEELIGQYKYEEAKEQYQIAIDSDPDFGSAYVGLATIFSNLRQNQEADKYYKEALARIDRMPEREKYRTLGAYFFRQRDFKKAIEYYSELVEKFPADLAGNTNLGLAHYFMRNMNKAVEQGLKTINLRPGNINLHYNLIWYAIGAGDLDLAREYAEKVLVISPERQICMFYVSLAMIELLQGSPEKAAEAYRPIEAWGSAPASIAKTGLADLALYEGRLSDANKILEKAIEEDRKLGSAARKLIMLAELKFSLGQKELALEAVEQAVEESNRLEIIFPAAQMYEQSGQENKAKYLAAKLSEIPEAVSQAYSKLIEGDILLGKDDIEGAIQLYMEAQNMLNTWHGCFALGKAYLKSELYAEALQEFEVCLKRQGEAVVMFLNDVPTSRYLPQIYYYIGRAQEGMGSASASESYREFLKIKEKGEADWMIEDARRRISK